MSRLKFITAAVDLAKAVISAHASNDGVPGHLSEYAEEVLANIPDDTALVRSYLEKGLPLPVGHEYSVPATIEWNKAQPEPEKARFVECEPLKTEGNQYALAEVIGPGLATICGSELDAITAKALRDWLNKALLG